MSAPALVPTIDVSALAGDDARAAARVVAEIDGALRGVGFFYARGHGIDVARLQREVNAFHRRMSHDEKWRLAIHAYNPANPHVRNGYYMAVDGRKAVESFCYLNPSFTDDHPAIRARAPLHEVNWWPDPAAHPGMRVFCEQYYRDVLALSRRLLGACACALGRDPRYFDAHVRLADSLSAVSLIRYPHLDAPPPPIRAADGEYLSFEAHADVSLLTVLWQTPVPNLQARTADGWRDLPVSADDFLVNCGSFMAHLTHDYYPAPVHRVKWGNAERLSLPFFVHAGNDSVLTPFHPDGQPRAHTNAPLRYGDYLARGLAALIAENGQT